MLELAIYLLIPAYLVIGLAFGQSALWMLDKKKLMEILDEVVAEAKAAGDLDPQVETFLRAHLWPLFYGISAVAWPWGVASLVSDRLKKLVR